MNPTSVSNTLNEVDNSLYLDSYMQCLVKACKIVDIFYFHDQPPGINYEWLRLATTKLFDALIDLFNPIISRIDPEVKPALLINIHIIKCYYKLLLDHANVNLGNELNKCSSIILSSSKANLSREVYSSLSGKLNRLQLAYSEYSYSYHHTKSCTDSVITALASVDENPLFINELKGAITNISIMISFYHARLEYGYVSNMADGYPSGHCRFTFEYFLKDTLSLVKRNIQKRMTKESFKTEYISMFLHTFYPPLDRDEYEIARTFATMNVTELNCPFLGIDYAYNKEIDDKFDSIELLQDRIGSLCKIELDMEKRFNKYRHKFNSREANLTFPHVSPITYHSTIYS